MGQLPNENGQCFCQKQKKWLKEGQFYTYKDGTKTQICKKCLTLHIDNFNPDTFLWLLEKMDVPYIPAEWNNLRDRAFAKDPVKMNGMSVFGKYLSKMKLNQWHKYGWADSETIQAQRDLRGAEISQERQAADAEYQKELRQKYLSGQINESQYKTLMPTPIQNQQLAATSSAAIDEAVNNPFQQQKFMKEEELPDPAADLTQEDKLYLAMKWGRLYKPNEWIELEQNYKRMTDSFDIQDADTENSLILYCKNNLKMNQALDCGDLDGYNKISRTQDALRKSSKFAAKERKEQDSDFIGSVSQLVAYCQRQGGRIPKYQIKVPYDIIDKVIDDLKAYNKSLIYEDPAIQREIEEYLKKKNIQEELKKDRQEAKNKGLVQRELTDQDFVDYKEQIQKQKIEDDSLYQEEGDVEE